MSSDTESSIRDAYSTDSDEEYLPENNFTLKTRSRRRFNLNCLSGLSDSDDFSQSFNNEIHIEPQPGTSAAPGKYSLTDIKNGDNNSQSVEILAKYPWGSQLVETLNYNTIEKTYPTPQFQFKEGKKQVQAHTVVSQVNLCTMFLNTICDAFEESLFQDKPRTVLRFHRKLAPYKISFSITGSSVATTSELNDLALYLCKQLRTNHVSTLLLPSSSRNTLEAQYRQYDQLGIPYNVVLNENTLKNGIAQLRSRDTTLKEQVHVTELVTYVDQLFKNY